MINWERCIGCEICQLVCPVNAIEMKNDKEGFRYPHINLNQCVHCNKCEQECPIQKSDIEEIRRFDIKWMCGHFKNPKETLKSSSGGFATALARNFIKNQGVVFGVAYAKNFKSAEFRCATTMDELEDFRGSKYVQTRKQDLYIKIKHYIQQKRKVLIIGLPCDIGAVVSYFASNPDLNLIYTCELICHGVTSEKVLTEYQHSILKDSLATVTNFELRHKDEKWTPFYIKTQYDNGTYIKEPYSDSIYKKTFFVLLRESCYQCLYKGNNSKADITIGDYWGISEKNAAFQKEGVSAILVRSSKGQSLLNGLEEYELFSADSKIICDCNPSILFATKKHELRDEFSEQFQSNGIISACEWLDKRTDLQNNQKKKNMRVMEKLRCVLRLIQKRN